MSKRIARPRKQGKIKRQRKNKRKQVVTICALIFLVLIAGVTARWPTLSRMIKPSPQPQQGSFSASSPSKEYIYAGGRLIATEEPSSSTSPAPAAPASLTATASSSTSVTVTWAAPTGSPVDHYEVEKAESYQGPFTPVLPNPGAAATSITDTNVTAGKAYLYRVRAVNAAGAASAFSTDIATAIVFTDELANTTPIKAQHLVELRQAVNAVRHLAGKLDATWTYPDPASSPPGQRRKIYLEDVTELRTNLDEALQVLGRYQEYPATPPLGRGGLVYKEHFQQIRDRVR